MLCLNVAPCAVTTVDMELVFYVLAVNNWMLQCNGLETQVDSSLWWAHVYVEFGCWKFSLTICVDHPIFQLGHIHNAPDGYHSE